MSITTGMIAQAFAAIRAAVPACVVPVLHVASGRVLSAVRSVGRFDASATVAGITPGALGGLRFLVSEMGGVEIADGDLLIIEENQNDVKYRALSHRYDQTRETMLVEYGDANG